MPTPTITFENLIKPATQQEVQNSIYKVLGTLGLNTSSWKAGAVVRTITTAFSVFLSALSSLQALIARQGFLELSEEDWLSTVAFYVYGVTRIPATYATGFVTLTNSAGGVYSFDPGDLVFANPVTNKTYRNTATVAIPALATVTNVPVQAVEVGADSTSTPETITKMVVTVTGVAVKNPESVVGQDEETDAALRQRCSAKLGALSPMGPHDAYTSAVRNATRPDGSSLGITRTRVDKDGFGNVFVWMATPSGAVPPADVAIATEAVYQNAEPLAVTAHVASAVPVTITVNYELWMYNTSGQTDAQVQELIKQRLTSWFQEQPIGGNVISLPPGKIYLDKIKAVIGDTLPEIFHVELSVPSSDVSLALSQVAVLGPVAGIIHQVPTPEGVIV